MAYQLYLENFDQQDWRDCTAQGDVEEACQYLVRRYLDQFHTLPIINVRRYLEQTGGWEREELAEMDAEELFTRLVFSEAPTMLEHGMLWID